mmetsp:Transcript_40001/g.55602  ORF Transcript_40001/g.55602 Transcript_40001/m.55602 type:complete len:89 (+) Transcript_40001:266-532(+)|eukprot:CAMPEP_0196579360 /NCGR_PEP_ID=MMETSP1081-20130531/20725_1 /TAXON_ID=36882 /ORGANISM="Pyramimonas amylifera, Strain CCMP720" /LENGTH=88 /DNA_ID=CAMNT_0041898915 /DNA_START=259 /DNA_END=525 /DNA_ORIENTATION=-
MLVKKVEAAYPGKFDFTWNETDILKQTVPAGEGWEGALWRKGAFEIMRKDTGEILYSKKEEGSHLVDGKGGPEGKLSIFINTILANVN